MVVFRFLYLGDCMRNIGYKRAFSFLILSWALVIFPMRVAVAQTAAPGYNGKVTVAVEGIISARLKRLGFAANDPRFKATNVGISTGLSYVATGLMIGGATVSWPVLLAGAGIAALISGAVALATDSDYKWAWGNDGSITLSGTSPGTPALNFSDASGVGQINPLVLGGQWARGTVRIFNPSTARTEDKVVTGSNPGQVALIVAYYSRGIGGFLSGPCLFNVYYWSCPVTLNGNSGNLNISLEGGKTGSPVASTSGLYDERPPNPPSEIPTQVFAKADDAVKVVPDAVRSQPVSPAVLAAAANAVWKAAQPAKDSGGIPWSASDPITPAEVSQWLQQNPSSHPTVGDFFAPANPVANNSSIGFGGSSSSPGGGGVPATPAPGEGTTPSPDPDSPAAPVTPGEGQEVDWGPNPNIGAPGLETTPTAASILDPIFNLMPSLKNWAVPAHQAECPTAGFSVYGTQYLIDAHCGLMEQNRNVIGVAMLLVFSLASLFIVLRA